MYIEYTPLESPLQTILRNPVTAAALLVHVEAAEEAAAATEALQLQAEAAEEEGDAAAAVVTAASLVNSTRAKAAEGGLCRIGRQLSSVKELKAHQSIEFKAAAAIAATKLKLSEALRENLENFHNGIEHDEDDEAEEFGSYELIDIVDGEDDANNEEYINLVEKPIAANPLVNGGYLVKSQSRQKFDQSKNLVFELEDEDFEYVITKVPKKSKGQQKFERNLHKTFSTPTSISKAKRRPVPAAIPIAAHLNIIKHSKSAPKFRLLNGNLNSYSRSISQDSLRSRSSSLSDRSSCSSQQGYNHKQSPRNHDSARYFNGFTTAEIGEEEGEDKEYIFKETHFELVQDVGGDYRLQESDNIVPVKTFSSTQDSPMGIDIFTKLRNLLYPDSKSDTNAEKRKRRRSNDWSPDVPAVHKIKYRKVDNHFPKIITGPLDNDLDTFPFPKKPEKPLLLQQHNHNQLRFVNVPLSMSHRKPIHPTENSSKQERKSIFEPPLITHKVVKNRSYAEVEFSDDDEPEITNGFVRGGVGTFNGPSNHLDFGKVPKVFNIPISHRAEERMKFSMKSPPPLIDSRSGSILASTRNLPEVRPTRPTYYETLQDNMTFGNIIPTHRVPSSSSSSSGGSNSLFTTHNIFNGIGKCFGKSSSSQPKRSILQQETQTEDGKIYEEFLKQCISNYNNNIDVTSQQYKVLPSSIIKPRRSTLQVDAPATSTANNSLYANQRQLKRQPLTSTINLDDDDDDVEVTFDSSLTTRHREFAAKDENITSICIDDDDSDIVELREDERKILSACSKLNYEYKKDKHNEKEKENFRRSNELPHVEPVNSLKLQFSTSPHLKENWLENLQAKRDKKKKENQEQVLQFEKEALEQSEKRRQAEFNIQEKLRNCKIYSDDLVIIDDFPEPEEEELIPLTNAHIARVQAAIRGSADQILISKFNLNITRRDIHTLLGQNWLNDEVINFYMNLLTERGETKHDSHGMPRVYAMNTFFIPRLMQAGHSGVKRWTRKIDIFAKDIIPVPVHVGGVHWCMAIIHLKERSIKYYDSMGTPNPNVLKALEQYLKDESMDKRNKPFDTSQFEIESVREVPRQMNGSDCGVFSCMFAEFICRNKEINFSQQNMEYFRQKMILEIVQGELLQ